MTRSIGAGTLRNTLGVAMDAPSSGITRLNFGLGWGVPSLITRNVRGAHPAAPRVPPTEQGQAEIGFGARPPGVFPSTGIDYRLKPGDLSPNRQAWGLVADDRVAPVQPEGSCPVA